MFYAIRHVTRFHYSAPISESVLEVRMQPRNDGSQRLLSFGLHTAPRAQVAAYSDALGNHVHYFDIPERHTGLTITARATVEVLPPAPGPAAPRPAAPGPDALGPDAWDRLDAMTATDEYWDFLMPSRYVRPGPLLYDLMRELRLHRGADPLGTLRGLTAAVHGSFDYVPQSTLVNSPVDDALRARRGVCQDFAHVMIALARELRVPCRYVSGYLFHRGADDRSAGDATHAWVESLLPDLGWVGFDPTNNVDAGERHIRVAVGRDYADVPPTHGVFRGRATSELSVAVQVAPSAAPPDDAPSGGINWSQPSSGRGGR